MLLELQNTWNRNDSLEEETVCIRGKEKGVFDVTSSVAIINIRLFEVSYWLLWKLSSILIFLSLSFLNFVNRFVFLFSFSSFLFVDSLGECSLCFYFTLSFLLLPSFHHFLLSLFLRSSFSLFFSCFFLFPFTLCLFFLPPFL